tara:strand:- start:1234 stop:1578 length:345 start_codon:yes stop_codon:yes gene_type:complete
MDIRGNITQLSNNGNSSFIVKFIKRAFFPFIMLVLINVIFTFIYLIFCNDPEDWNGMDQPDDSLFTKIFNRFYFSLTGLTTIGYGDISPKSTKARSIVMIQLIFVLMEILAFVI